MIPHDVRRTNDAIDRLLEVTTNPRHRFLLQAFYRHRFLEIAGRYDLAQRDRLIADRDGSVDLYLQAASPGKDKEANWLPAPKGKFALVLRMYGPKQTAPTIVDGSWTPPPVKRVQ